MAIRHRSVCTGSRLARIRAGGETQGVVAYGHEIGRHSLQDAADTLSAHRSNLFGLSFGSHAQPGGNGGLQRLEGNTRAMLLVRETTVMTPRARRSAV